MNPQGSNDDSLNKIEEAKRLYETYLEVARVAMVPLRGTDDPWQEVWTPAPLDAWQLPPSDEGGIVVDPLTIRWA